MREWQARISLLSEGFTLPEPLMISTRSLRLLAGIATLAATTSVVACADANTEPRIGAQANQRTDLRDFADSTICISGYIIINGIAVCR